MLSALNNTQYFAQAQLFVIDTRLNNTIDMVNVISSQISSFRFMLNSTTITVNSLTTQISAIQLAQTDTWLELTTLNATLNMTISSLTTQVLCYSLC